LYVGSKWYKATERLYQLKYQDNRAAAAEIIAAAATYLRPHRTKIDLIIPVPPSTPRAVQPVLLLAVGIGAALGLLVANSVTTTRTPSPLKNIPDATHRQALLNGLYAVDHTITAHKNILLFDDLFRSRTTMNAITDLLLDAGKANSVRALTITKAQSNQ